MPTAVITWGALDPRNGTFLAEVVVEPGYTRVEQFVFPSLGDGGPSDVPYVGCVTPAAGALALLSVGGRVRDSESAAPVTVGWHSTRDFGNYEFVPSMAPNVLPLFVLSDGVQFSTEEGSSKVAYGPYISVDNGLTWSVASIAIDGPTVRTDLPIYVANDKFLTFDAAASFVSDNGVAWSAIAPRADITAVGFAHGVYWAVTEASVMRQISNLTNAGADFTSAVPGAPDMSSAAGRHLLAKAAGELYYGPNNGTTTMYRVANTGASPLATAFTAPRTLGAFADGVYFTLNVDGTAVFWRNLLTSATGTLTLPAVQPAQSDYLATSTQPPGGTGTRTFAIPGRLRSEGVGGPAPVPPPFWQGHTVTYEVP